ncbi:MAG: MBOAT family protein, partial [Gemmatimonadales bacterium]|nr:MBOAT family protein [Gemmatimonadales bacterium]
DRRLAYGWLLLASLFFYAWWNPANLVIIIGSVGFNYVIAQRWIQPAPASRRTWYLTAGIATNLALLAYFKYANFFVDTWNTAGGPPLHLQRIVLPIAISFFTFQQIVFLVEAYRGKASDYDLLHYALLVTFFPHLIAGPIVHYREMLNQFARPSLRRFAVSHVAVGITIFCLGLFKKVVMADGVAPYANAVFGAASSGIALTFAEAWIGALAYTFQLYFDFSGYSDMAIGLARMIGIRFPMNFNSPYKATNIIDFWRRWHITLSRFLRDYLYIPLGGNRNGPIRRHVNLLATMLLGGLWHGAGWTFVIWGGLHGCYLVVNHFWHAARARLGLGAPTMAGKVAARALTFGCVVVAWVFFRALDYATARSVLDAMFLGRGLSLPSNLAGRLADSPLAALAGLRFDGPFHNGLVLEPVTALLWIGALALIAWFAPNTQEILARYRPALGFEAVRGAAARYRWLLWRPSTAWSLLVAVLAAMALANMWVGDNAEFLYFQF